MKFKPAKSPEIKMGELRFSGESDDVVGVSGWLSEEFSPDTWILIGKVLLIRFTFGSVGTGWIAQTAMAMENVPVPFPVRIEYGTHSAYSPTLIVECPVGTSVELESNEDDES